MHIKSGDMVYVIAGKDKKKEGKVLKSIPKSGKIIVEGVNMVSRHTKPRGPKNQGGIIKKEAAIDASNVMLFCKNCKAPRRAEIKILDNEKKEHIRVCKKCKESFDK